MSLTTWGSHPSTEPPSPQPHNSSRSLDGSTFDPKKRRRAHHSVIVSHYHQIHNNAKSVDRSIGRLLRHHSAQHLTNGGQLKQENLPRQVSSANVGKIPTFGLKYNWKRVSLTSRSSLCCSMMSPICCSIVNGVVYPKHCPFQAYREIHKTQPNRAEAQMPKCSKHLEGGAKTQNY